MSDINLDDIIFDPFGDEEFDDQFGSDIEIDPTQLAAEGVADMIGAGMQNESGEDGILDELSKNKKSGDEAPSYDTEYGTQGKSGGMEQGEHIEGVQEKLDTILKNKDGGAGHGADAEGDDDAGFIELEEGQELDLVSLDGDGGHDDGEGGVEQYGGGVGAGEDEPDTGGAGESGHGGFGDDGFDPTGAAQTADAGTKGGKKDGKSGAAGKGAVGAGGSKGLDDIGLNPAEPHAADQQPEGPGECDQPSGDGQADGGKKPAKKQKGAFGGSKSKPKAPPSADPAQVLDEDSAAPSSARTAIVGFRVRPATRAMLHEEAKARGFDSLSDMVRHFTKIALASLAKHADGSDGEKAYIKDDFKSVYLD